MGGASVTSMLDGGTRRDASPAPRDAGPPVRRDAGPPAARFALALTGSGWQQPHTVLFDPSGALVVYGVTGGEMRVVGRTVAAARDPAWFLLKIAPDGELLWHATIDGAALDVADNFGWSPAMAVGPDGAIAIAAGLEEARASGPRASSSTGPTAACAGSGPTPEPTGRRPRHKCAPSTSSTTAASSSRDGC